MELPPRLLGAVGTSAAQGRCICSCCIHFSMFWKCLGTLSIDFDVLTSFRDHIGHLHAHQVDLEGADCSRAEISLLGRPRLPAQLGGRGGIPDGL